MLGGLMAGKRHREIERHRERETNRQRDKDRERVRDRENIERVVEMHGKIIRKRLGRDRLGELGFLFGSNLFSYDT
jgi:hypothetical protein